MPHGKLPLVLATLSVAAVGVLLLYQGWNSAQVRLAPEVGRACFERHLPILPPGTQYEGFSASGDRVRVKVMTGADLRTLECAIDARGRLLPAGGD